MSIVIVLSNAVGSISFILLLVLVLPFPSNCVITDVKIRTYTFDDVTGEYSEYNATYIQNDTIILKEKSSVRIQCHSDSNIDWDIQTKIDDIRLTVSHQYLILKGTAQYVFVSSIWTKLDYSNTGNYSCWSKGGIKTYYIYIQGSKAFVANEGNLVYDGIIGCRVSDPSIPISLYRIRTKSNIKVNAEYNPKVGFVLNENNFTAGKYICQTEAGEKSPVYEIVAPTELEYSPRKSVLTGFSGENITIGCRSTNTGDAVSYYLSTQNSTNETFSSTANAPFQFQLKEKEKGNVTCSSEQTGLSHTWTFKSIDNLRLDFIRKTGSALCFGGSLDIQFYSLKCENPNVCRIRKFCLNDIKKCREMIFEGSLCRPGNCSRLIQYHHSGIFFCQNEGAAIAVEYFTGLNRLIYTDFGKAPNNALVQLDEIDPIVYTNPGKSVSFYCEATEFLFMSKLQFAFRYKNDSIQQISDESMRVDSRAEDRIGQNIVGRGVFLNLTEDVVELICMAPWNNATSFFNVSRRFQVKYEQPPVLHGESVHTFTVGDTFRVILCKGEGQPPPQLQWLRNNRTVSEPFTTTKTAEGWLYLNFPQITEEHEELFICEATNSQGTVQKDFSVKVHERNKLSTSALIGIACATSLVFIFGIVTVFILWRKYKYIKNHLRDLTDEEVDEFILGNARHISAINLYTDNPQHLPYNTEYEIPENELILDKENHLGSGAYGMVIKGTFTGLPVAVKMTKPNAEVSYLKALLSELKVMMYIGKHPHIVEFLGACTANMKKRIVFLVMEFCPFGSLNQFLCSSRKASIPKIGEHSEDSVKLPNIKLTDIDLYNNCNRVTPGNMLTWAHAIASGMAHLESRRVIHGDLATRNILLFPKNIVKITDFGLSKQLYQYSQYTKNEMTLLPWRWMALETLQEFSFSFKSDVWAYGVTLWEIFSFGKVPFPNKTWNEEFVEDLTMGMRLNCPRHCSKKIYEIMADCWKDDPGSRPSFCELIARFESELVHLVIGY